MDFRAQVTSIRDVIARRHLKVAFFGRTSCGKSSVINALLGENVLPMGLGHTTTKFVHVQGTDSENPYLEHENGEKLDLDGESKLLPVESSGVFSTGATGAIAPVILRKRLIAPVIFHLPRFWFSICSNKRPVITALIPSIEEGILLQKFLLRSRACSLY